MPIQDNIKCSVSNCRYWNSQKCTASAIEVNVNDGGTTAPDSKQTQCRTFAPGSRA